MNETGEANKLLHLWEKMGEIYWVIVKPVEIKWSYSYWEIALQLTREAKEGEHVLDERDPLLTPYRHGKTGLTNREMLKQSARKKKECLEHDLSNWANKKYFSESFCKSQQGMVLLLF